MTIPGIGAVTAVAILAEIGLDMTRFPTAAHLCSWAKFTPLTKESAGRTKGRQSTGHGNRYLARALGEAAVMAGRSHTFLGARYHRIARRRGKPRAIVAVGRSVLVAIWHVCPGPGPRSPTSGPTTTRPASTTNAPPAPTSRRWKGSDTRSPSPPRADPAPPPAPSIRLRDMAPVTPATGFTPA